VAEASKTAFLILATILFYGMQTTTTVKTLLALILWCILFVLCWPLALVMIILFPIVWLLLLPFKIVGLSIDLVFKLISAILLFPFKLAKSL
jgi:hypothetical protein